MISLNKQKDLKESLESGMITPSEVFSYLAIEKGMSEKEALSLTNKLAKYSDFRSDVTLEELDYLL